MVPHLKVALEDNFIMKMHNWEIFNQKGIKVKFRPKASFKHLK